MSLFGIKNKPKEKFDDGFGKSTWEVENKKSEKKLEEKDKPAYFYQWGKHHTSKYGGQDGDLNVYEVKNGEFVLIGKTFVQTRAMKGFEGEAMDVLFKAGKISKEEYDKDNGYYRRDKHNFKISQAGSMN